MINSNEDARKALQTSANTLSALRDDSDPNIAHFANAVLDLQDVIAYVLTRLERR